jgi:hypothetical protein
VAWVRETELVGEPKYYDGNGISELPNYDRVDPNGNAVFHPTHYNSHPSGIECIEIVRHMNFNLGNAMKYIWRADLKGTTTTIEDLEKAAFYIADEIVRRSND